MKNYQLSKYVTDTYVAVIVYICIYNKYGSTEPESGWPCCDRQKDKGACNRKVSGSASTHFHDKLDP